MQRYNTPRTQRVPFHYISSTTLSSGQGSVAVAPVNGFSPRLLAIADTYALYKMEKLEYRLIANTSSQTVLYTMSYIPGVVDTPPASSAAASENLYTACLGVRQTKHSEWMKIPPEILSGYLPWYKAVTGTLDVSEEYQGVLYFTGTSAETVYWEIRGVCVFKNSVPEGSTPMLRQKKLDEIERERILRLIAYSPTPAGDSSARSVLKSGSLPK